MIELVNKAYSVRQSAFSGLSPNFATIIYPTVGTLRRNKYFPVFVYY